MERPVPSEGAVREANPPCKAEALSGANISSEAPAPGCREKPLCVSCAVPQTDTGG